MLTAAEIAQKIRAGELSAVEVAQQTLQTIQAKDPEIQAFVSLTEDLALNRAAQIDEAVRLGSPVGPLAGVPVAIKDNMNLKGTRTTCASRILENYVSPYTATVVDRLLAAGAIPVGKVNMDEFAMGSSTENSALKCTVNPWDHGRVPGGSSGGSAAAVSAGFTPISLGSDTGGSVRLPAAFTGTLALKPTYGRMSRYGLVAFASSLDQIGPFALSTKDLALVMDATSGRDPLDSTSLDVKPDFASALGQDIKGMRFAYIKESLGAGNTPGVQAALDRTREVLESLGATFSEVSLPTLEYGIAAYYLICTSEASSNLARYDGMVYSSRVPAEEFNTSMSRTRGEHFGHEVKRRILMGTYALSSGYYDAFYSKAMKVRKLIAQDFQRAFQDFDVLVTPTSPFPAFKFGEKSSDPVAMYQSDVDTVSINLAGVPAISVPAGFETVEGKGLPIGIQFIAPALKDERLITVSDAFERVTAGAYLKVAP
ncbi:Asp-tRNA(Asn)/Glu-tRNA(Gln) amidotransferase subunit GatA [Deinococcus roseus]|uniref:Glutamyl-tRNA(Gln) amidotransferase subunit A n=1 Tax=Deinococcus roseus TaxID=392414 RepID=A0ABQ2CWS5_9DEIO|nr:Asp-tRNA(Asn)/Glu-tRNA(Gln) amidotransferase subunit GatA [Deinococcus roseus]GGJ24434.1 glutamyl-tRNA(Gln) amidotransferase subunit A [Deinococcus roseus]